MRPFGLGRSRKIASVAAQTAVHQRSRLARTVAFILLCSEFACTSFGPISPKEYIPIEHPTRVWVTKSDNSVVKVQLPKLLGDTLVGYVNGDYQEMILSQTKQVQAKRLQSGRTALMAGAVVLGVVTTGVVIAG